MKGMWHCGVGVLLWNRRVRQGLFNTVHLSKDLQKLSSAEDHSGQGAGGGGVCRGPRKDCGWSVYVKNTAGAGREGGHSAEALAEMVTQLNELRWHWWVLAEKPSSKPKSDSKSHSTRPSPLVIQLRGLIIIISTGMIIPTATLSLRL